MVTRCWFLSVFELSGIKPGLFLKAKEALTKAQERAASAGPVQSSAEGIYCCRICGVWLGGERCGRVRCHWKALWLRIACLFQHKCAFVASQLLHISFTAFSPLPRRSLLPSVRRMRSRQHSQLTLVCFPSRWPIRASDRSHRPPPRRASKHQQECLFVWGNQPAGFCYERAEQSYERAWPGQKREKCRRWGDGRRNKGGMLWIMFEGEIGERSLTCERQCWYSGEDQESSSPPLCSGGLEVSPPHVAIQSFPLWRIIRRGVAWFTSPCWSESFSVCRKCMLAPPPHHRIYTHFRSNRVGR